MKDTKVINNRQMWCNNLKFFVPNFEVLIIIFMYVLSSQKLVLSPDDIENDSYPSGQQISPISTPPYGSSNHAGKILNFVFLVILSKTVFIFLVFETGTDDQSEKSSEDKKVCINLLKV